MTVEPLPQPEDQQIDGLGSASALRAGSAVVDRCRDEVVELSIEGHDRDCALAMLSQARHSRPFGFPLTDVQVAHLLAIGYRAGASRARDRIAREMFRRAVRVLEESTGEPELRRAQASAFEVAGLIAGGGEWEAAAIEPGGTDSPSVPVAAKRPGEAGSENASKEDNFDA
jgi:hypothetical protein